MNKTTACVIVRNEEENLPRWLDCMKELADEMFVVDTGSTDRTVELGRAAGAKVFSFTWCDDFSAAKNFALDQVKGGWVFFLDADEYFSKRDIPAVRKAIAEVQEQENVIGFVCRMMNVDRDNGNRVLNESLHIRIFRSLPELRYVGAVHEQLRYSGAGKKKMILLPGAVIYHTGYSAGQNERKAKRNLRILFAQQAAGRGTPADLCYMADAYYGLGDYGKAAEAARQAVEAGAALPGRETRMYGTWIQSLFEMGTPWQELEPIVLRAERDYPYVPDFRALLGFAAWKQGAETNARDFFRQAKRLYKEFLRHRQDATASYPDEMQGMLKQIEACLAQDEAKSGNGPRISAAVITKNEEGNLPVWLECMRHLADERIVVDTGSTDRTVELARQAGAKVCFFPWIDDFAAAKNYAIDQTTGDWVLLFDADEYIKPEEYEKLKAAIRRYDGNPSVIGLASRWVNIDKKRHGAYVSAGYQLRVFRRIPELRYTGMIHEMLQYTGRDKKTMPFVEDFTIYHTGYTASVMPEKFARNLRLLKLSQEKYGSRTADDMYFADCYFGLKQYEKAIGHARKYLAASGRSAGAENRPYAIWIQSLLLLHRPLDEIAAVADQALREFPYSAEFKIQEGNARFDAGDYRGAERCYIRALDIYREAKQRKVWRKQLLSDEAGAMLPQVYCDLCQLKLWQGKETAAWENLQQAMSLDKYRPSCCRMLMKLLQQQDDVIWIETLNQLYDRKKDAAFILQVLPESGRDKVRLYYLRQTGSPLDDAESFLLAGRLEASSAALAEEMDSLLCLSILDFLHDAQAPGRIGALLPPIYRQAAAGQGESVQERRITRKLARMEQALAKAEQSRKKDRRV